MFKSKAQEKAAFAGKLGPEMRQRAPEFAAKTDQSALPEHVEASPGTGPRRRVFRRKPKALTPSKMTPKL